MKRRISIAVIILVFSLSIIGLSSFLTSKSPQVMAGNKIEYKVVPAGKSKMGDEKHMERLLNAMANEGWEYINVIPLTDLVTFKK